MKHFLVMLLVILSVDPLVGGMPITITKVIEGPRVYFGYGYAFVDVPDGCGPPYRAAPASPGYIGVFQDGDELSTQEQAARLNELESDNARWRALCDDAARGMAAAGRDVERMGEEISRLRLALDDAHQHVGALVKMIPPTSINKDRNAAILSARAWLRRGAK